jgi:DNA-directed RNA polymerase subunit RPC12/RpoP
MKFGIIQCIKCGKAHGIALRSSTTTCPYCNKKLKIKPKTIKFQSNSESDLIHIIQEINNQVMSASIHDLSNGCVGFVNVASGQAEGSGPAVAPEKKPYKPPANLKQLVESYKGQQESLQVIQTLAIDLGRISGEFNFEDLENIFGSCGFDVDKVEEYIKKLKDLDIIYEPREGRYRLLD